jgi:hypothetical protein
MSEKIMIKSIVVDTLNAIQNNQYMGMLDKRTMVTRDKWKDFGVDIYAFMIDDLQRLGFEVVLVLGYEGSGKSFGIKYLQPGTCMWYNADRKNPTFKNVEFDGNKYKAREVYGTKNKPSNYMFIPKTYREITAHIESIQTAGLLAEKRVAFLIGHVEDYKSDGETRQRLKTLGGLASKMNIEGSVENCFYTKLNTVGDRVEFKLDTSNSGSNTARSLEDAFDARYIDNNFHLVYEAIVNY